MGDNISAILEGLNSEQKKAVSCVDGPVLIVAGAGSGKTRVLTSRIAYLIAQGCDPSRILSLTFTKKAASEMKERVGQMVGARNAWKIQMGTFHSVFIRFLRDYADLLGYPKEFTVYDQSDSTSLVKTCIKELQLDDKVYKPKDVLARISSAKNSLVSPGAYRNNGAAIENDVRAKKGRLVDIYQKYWEKCRAAGVMDFDDILFNMNILLRNHEQARNEIAGRFSFVMVDEYQDTNYAQYLILKALSAAHHNLCVVGDDSQSIYAFRGAKVENILNFRKDYPEAKVFRLEQNYRSTQVIVNAANTLIEKNEARIPKTCFSAGEEGELIKLVEGYTDKEEAMLIANEIISRIQTDKAQYQDFAVLYRTNSQSRAIEEMLRKRNIPYMIYSGNSFFDRQEVKDLMAYFKLVVNPRDDESFRRVVNKPARGIGDTSLDALAKAAADHGCTLVEAAYLDDIVNYFGRAAAVTKIREFCDMIRKFSVDAVGQIVDDGVDNQQLRSVPPTDAYKLAVSVAVESGILAMYKSDTSIEGQSRTANVEELLNSVKGFVEERHNEDFEAIQMNAGGDGTSIPEDFQISESDLPVVTLGAFLENISLLSAIDVKEEDDENSDNKVALMTVHTSKGLEFPYVIVSGMEENLFPTGGMLASPADIQEERRLFYVAMTRAKNVLVITYSKQRMRNGKTEFNPPSRFVREIDPRYIKNPLPIGAVGDSDDDAPFWGQTRGGSFGAGSYGSGSGSSYGGGSSRGGSFGGGSRGQGYSYGGSSRAVTERRPTSAGSSMPARGTVAGSRPVGGPSSSTRPGGVSASRPSSSGTARPIARPAGAGQRPLPAPEVDFIPSPVSELKVGVRVQHNRFGYGKIVDLSGSAVDLKARILFDDFGEKILILKYAKIRVVKD